MPRPLAALSLVVVVFGVLAVIAWTTAGTLRMGLIVLAVPVLTAFGAPLVLGRVRRKTDQLALDARVFAAR